MDWSRPLWFYLANIAFFGGWWYVTGGLPPWGLLAIFVIPVDVVWAFALHDEIWD